MISQNFVVKVLDVDEHSTNQPPIDLKPKEDLLVSENQPTGTIVGQLEAVDPRGVLSLFTCLMKKE